MIRLLLSAFLLCPAAFAAELERPVEASLPAAQAAPELPALPPTLPAIDSPALAPAASLSARLAAAPRVAKAAVYLALASFTAKPADKPVEAYLRETFDYSAVSKRPALVDGALVEASGQTPTRVSLSHPGLRNLLKKAESLQGREDERLAAVAALVRKTLPRAGDRLDRRALLLKSAKEGRAVELGAFVKERSAATSREYALLSNVALQRAGFKPKLAAVGDALVNLVHAGGRQVVFDPSSAERHLKPAEGALGDAPRVFIPFSKPKTGAVTAQAGALTFSVETRSSAERLFKKEQEAYEAAKPDEKVTVEWHYFPFYLPDGHNALRVGDKLYEFVGSKGWRVFPSARGFVFSNPFFKTQLGRHPEMPPFSLGVPFEISKAATEKFVRYAEERDGKGGIPLSIFFHNCNQVPLRLLKRVGVDLGLSPFTRYFSNRTFRKLLLEPPAAAGAPRLYLLPNQGAPGEPLGSLVPKDVARERHWLVDLFIYLRHLLGILIQLPN